MGVSSDSHPHHGPDGMRDGLTVFGNVTAASGAGTAIDFATDLVQGASDTAVDCSASILRRFSMQNTDATLIVTVVMDDGSKSFELGPREWYHRYFFDTALKIELVESTAAAVVYLEATYDEDNN